MISLASCLSIDTSLEYEIWDTKQLIYNITSQRLNQDDEILRDAETSQSNFDTKMFAWEPINRGMNYRPAVLPNFGVSIGSNALSWRLVAGLIDHSPASPVAILIFDQVQARELRLCATVQSPNHNFAFWIASAPLATEQAPWAQPTSTTCHP